VKDVVAYFNALFQTLFEGNEENHEISH